MWSFFNSSDNQRAGKSVAKQRETLIGNLAMILGLALIAIQTGCSSTAAQSVHPFQPRPFQANSMRAQPFAGQSSYGQQRAFYSPFSQNYAQQYQPQSSPQQVYGEPAINQGNQAIFSRNPLGFPFAGARKNPLGFTGTNC